MNVVILGAGDIGLHLAMLFSTLEYGIVLIDKDPAKLELAARDLDITTKVGSGTDWELLEELKDLSPDLFLAMTDQDEINLVACLIAKNLGFPQTIARARSDKYFMQSRLFFERLFCVDHLIGPEKLTAQAIFNMIVFPGASQVESFANGSIQMRTMIIPENFKKSRFSLKERENLELPDGIMVALIKKANSNAPIFPHGDDFLNPGDEVTFIGEEHAMHKLLKFLSYTEKNPKSVAIVGGSLIGVHLAKQLGDAGIHVVIIEKDFNKCRELAETLPTTTILFHNGTDYRFLETENIAACDVFVACTRDDEVNFLASAAAKNLGAQRVIISLSDIHYIPLLNSLKIAQASSPRIAASNRILSIAREKRIASMVSLYENQAEIMEVKVSLSSKIAGIPIKHLGPEFPSDFLITVIQSRGRVFVADGSRVLTPGDTAIVISHPRHIEEIKKLF